MFIFAGGNLNGIMPDIYTYFGFIFSFYSNEHEPIHVHVEHQDKMTIFDMIIVDGDLVELRKRDKGKPLSISTSAQGKIKTAKDAPMTTNSFKEKKTYEYTYDKNGNLVQTISRLNGGLLEKYTYKYKK